MKEKEIAAILKIVEEAENTKLDAEAQIKHESVYYFEVYLRRHFEEVRAEAAKKPSNRNDEKDRRLERLVNLHNARSQKIRELGDDGKFLLIQKFTCPNLSSFRMLMIRVSNRTFMVCQS